MGKNIWLQAQPLFLVLGSIFSAVLLGFCCLSCRPIVSENSLRQAKIADFSAIRDSTQTIFWAELSKICGKAYSGTITASPPNDTAFSGKNLVMHLRACTENQIRIPFFVGTDSSRTWVLSRDASGILLQHDHRHADGSPDKITFYGGHTSNFGASTRQIFPANQETATMLPAAIGNVWWIDLLPGEYFTYNLRRVNTDRVFSVRFDLSNPIPPPGAPWGWKE